MKLNKILKEVRAEEFPVDVDKATKRFTIWYPAQGRVDQFLAKVYQPMFKDHKISWVTWGKELPEERYTITDELVFVFDTSLDLDQLMEEIKTLEQLWGVILTKTVWFEARSHLGLRLKIS